MVLEKVKVKLDDITSHDNNGITLKDGTWLSYDDCVIEGLNDGPKWTINPLVPSSMVEKIEYYPDIEELIIHKTQGGEPLIYIEVPKYIVLTLAFEKSMGRAYNSMVRGRFPLKGQK